MADQDIAGGGSGDAVARLVALTERQHELWNQLRDAEDESVRNQVFDELAANRQELSRLKEIVRTEVGEVPHIPPPRPAPTPKEEPPRSVGEQLRAQIISQPGGVAPPQPPPPPPPPPIDIIIPTARPRPSKPEPSEEEPVPDALGPVVSPTPPADGAPPTKEEPAAEEAPAPEEEEVPASPAQPEPKQPEPVASAAAPQDDSLRDAVIASGLAPEATPFRSREDDLAATRKHRLGRKRKKARVTDEELEERKKAAHDRFEDIEKVRPHRSKVFPTFAILVAIVSVGVAVWYSFFFEQDTLADTATLATPTTTTTASPAVPPEEVRAAVEGTLQELGYSMVEVTEQVGTIVLSGLVTTQADLEIVIDAAETLAGTKPVDTSRLAVAPSDDEIRTAALEAVSVAGFENVDVSVSERIAVVSGVVAADDRADLVAAVAAVKGVIRVIDVAGTRNAAAELSAELRRITDQDPVVFESSQLDVSAEQRDTLDRVAAAILSSEGPYVTIAAYTDLAGSAATNQQRSQVRAERVRAYLVAQGVSPDRLVADGRGEEIIPGTVVPVGLERRVEFEARFAVPPAVPADVRIGIVAPTGRTDLSFTQSLATAIDVLAGERGGVGIDISDGTSADDAAAALRAYATDGYDLVVAHGAEYEAVVAEVAADFPQTAFAWGPGTATLGLANLTVYEVAAAEGGYVLGVIAASITESEVIGVVGSIEGGDAQAYVEGFEAGVASVDPAITVLVAYTGSVSDVALAAEAASAHLDAGADVLTGTDGVVAGAGAVAIENNIAWLGTHTDQSALDEELVVASQVYHWEVALRQVLDDIAVGTLGRQTYTLDLGNGGIGIAYNPGYELAIETIIAVDAAAGDIISGLVAIGI